METHLTVATLALGLTCVSLSSNMASAKGLYDKFLKSENKYKDYAGKAVALSYCALSIFGLYNFMGTDFKKVSHTVEDDVN